MPLLFRHKVDWPAAAAAGVWVTLLCAAAAWWWVWSAFPPGGDDLSFRYFLDFPHRGFASDFLAAVRWRYCTDNIRLGNVMLMLLQGAGPLASALPAVALTGAVWLIWRGGRVVRRPAAMAAGLAAYLLLLPWYEGMSMLDFAYNYVVGAAVMLLFYNLFFSHAGTPWGMAGCAVAALAAGAWHEGFGLPLFCGASLWLMCHLRRAALRQWIMWALLVPGLLLLLTAPGNLGRMSAPCLEALGQPFYYHKFPLIIIYFIALGISAALRSTRRRLSGRHLFILALCATSVVMRTAQISYARAAWPGETMAIVGLLTLAAQLVPLPRGRRGVGVQVAVAFLLCGLVFVHLAAFMVQSRVALRERKEIDAAYARSAGGLVFCSRTLDYQTHPAALKRPYLDADYYGLFRSFYDAYHSRSLKTLRVVPRELRDVDVAPGVECDSALFLKAGYAYSPSTALESIETPLILHYSTGADWFGTEVETVHFVTPRGHEYVFYKPRRAFGRLSGHRITGVRR